MPPSRLCWLAISHLLADGTAQVASQSDGSTAYQVVNGHCDCQDFVKAPHQFCKQQARALPIARRAQELIKAKLHADTNGQAGRASLPAPASSLITLPPPHSATARGTSQDYT